jgi:hypothetical protein
MAKPPTLVLSDFCISSGEMRHENKGLGKHTIDCENPVENNIMEITLLEKLLLECIKVAGGNGVLSDAISSSSQEANLISGSSHHRLQSSSTSLHCLQSSATMQISQADPKQKKGERELIQGLITSDRICGAVSIIRIQLWISRALFQPYKY